MIPAIVVFLYLAAVLYIGIFAFRKARGKEEAEDYFLASRSLGSFVASAIGGLRELITDGQSGLLVPPKAPDAIAAAIERVLRDPALARQLGEGARRQVEEKFSVDLWMSRHVEVYRRAIKA